MLEISEGTAARIAGYDYNAVVTDYASRKVVGRGMTWIVGASAEELAAAVVAHGEQAADAESALTDFEATPVIGGNRQGHHAEIQQRLKGVKYHLVVIALLERVDVATL